MSIYYAGCIILFVLVMATLAWCIYDAKREITTHQQPNALREPQTIGVQMWLKGA